ncbi:hypothetical protein LEP1GSC047_2942 [Leptospira inadai serovar Lyme str. 10]|uniref:Uncharacterized protein n=1 Tax=Leptospira inadai serovar Lyme str. 10 TaxID=1049790 RepID=V6HJ98_9LEPT|nr:hypothetical protein LEP1GSC047_2942 [Leptospira inadai serovar Lyme str. 10]
MRSKAEFSGKFSILGPVNCRLLILKTIFLAEFPLRKRTKGEREDRY